ncbi:MAG TPA: class I SAM-dependent methyltransferase, partial [Phaeodactylibacter sp.]|nr:class I SAM-dependent methyltransferase [Phaeodactylibacter sp.]
LFRLVNFYKPKTMLELGTSLGISTLYQASASLNANFITLEGDPEIAKLARFHFEKFKIKNITLVEGQFDHTLLPALQRLKSLDYIFIDGNHRMQPTLSYFEEALKFAHNESVFVFDDIHWSEEMEAAWEKIKAHPQVRISIDLFHMGIVFFRKEKREKEHFVLLPLKWKPWASGKMF